MKRLIVLIIFLAALFISGCDNNANGGDGDKGLLTINLSGISTGARAIVPSESLTVASITITGDGPGSASFELSDISSETTTTESHYLVVGSWVITAVAKNSSGTVVASGSTTTTIYAAQVNTATITLSALSGSGSVSIIVSWPSGSVTDPSLIATLNPISGDSIELSTSLRNDGLSAALSNTYVPAGSYVLTVVLYDGDTEVGGGIDAVSVAKDMVTSGDLSLFYDPSIGKLTVDLTLIMSNPISVELSATASIISTASTSTISVSTDAADVTEYRWYVNGVRDAGASGTSYDFGVGRSAGVYRIGVLAFTATRIGSAFTVIQVTQTSSSSETADPGITVSISNPEDYLLGFDTDMNSVGIAAEAFTISANISTATAYSWQIVPSVSSVNGLTTPSILLQPSDLAVGTTYNLTVMAKINDHWYSGSLSFDAVQGSHIQ